VTAQGRQPEGYGLSACPGTLPDSLEGFPVLPFATPTPSVLAQFADPAAGPDERPGDSALIALSLFTVWAVRTGRKVPPVPVTQLTAAELEAFWDDYIPAAPTPRLPALTAAPPRLPAAPATPACSPPAPAGTRRLPLTLEIPRDPLNP
jgi:hypothetical protein